MLGAFCALAPTLALAQPDATDATKAQNPPNQPVGGNRGGNNRGGRNLTPEQRRQMEAQRQQQRALALRETLSQGGFTDAAVQNSIVNFAAEQEKARAALQEKWRAIEQALRGTTVTDTQLTVLLNDFRALADEEKARRAKALTTLETEVGLSKKPRLDALLLVNGITGEESAIVNGAQGQGGFGGRGGMGGGGGFTPFGFGG